MRNTRASIVTAVVAGATVLAGPLVGVASAAPGFTGSTPADGAVITQAANLPTVVSATFGEALTSPSSPVFASKIKVLLNGANWGCTQGISSDMKTLTCTPFTGNRLFDGDYEVDITANPSPTTGDTTATTKTLHFTIDTTPPQLNTRTPAADTRVQPPATVVATYTEKFPLDTSASSMTVTDSQANVVGGSSVATDPTASSGAITWTPLGALPSGVFTANATAVDVHGKTSSTSWQFTVDDVPPTPPTVVAPAYVNIANQHHVPITGSADNSTGNATAVRVTVSDATTTVTLPDVNVGNDGSWSAASVADLSGLADHALTISAKAIDLAGNLSAQSPDIVATKDAVAPNPAPSVTFPDATPLNAANPTLHVHGVTEPNAGVSLVAGDGTHTTAPVTTTAASGDGSYDAFIDTTALSDGVVTVTATATDAAGNTSGGSNTKSKDATPPGTPSITVFDPVNKANVNAPHTVSGTAPVGTTVNVWVSDPSNVHVSEVDGLSVDPSGNWTTTADVSTLASGPISAHAIAVDSSQNPSAEATKVTVKDVDVPAAPDFTAPTWVNGSTKSAVPMSGTAEPSTILHLVVTDSGAGTKTVDLPVDGNGAWSTTLDLHTFAEGAVSFAATVVDQAGNVSPETDGTSTKDTVAPATPAAPALSAPAPDTSVVTATGSGTNGDAVLVELTSDGGAGQATGSADVGGGAYSDPVDASSLADGTLTGVASETDPAGNTSAQSPSTTVIKDTTSPLVLVSSTPADGSSVTATPTLSATFNQQLDLAQSTVTLKDSVGAVLGHTAPTLSADKKTISVSPTNNPLSEASGYQVIFAVKDLSDSDSLTPTVTFAVDRTAPDAPTVATVADTSGGNVAAVPVTGSAAEPGGTIQVTLTDGTHDATAGATVAGDGTWETTVDASGLADGAVSATATQTDAAGNVSPPSPAAGAHKDTVAPAKPTLAWSGDVTQHAQTVVFSGTAEPGSTVAVSVDDLSPASPPVAGTTLADDATGAWSTPLSLSSLSEGVLTATAWATDAFGNVGAVQVVNGTKDTVAPSISLTAPGAPFSLGVVTARWHGSDVTSGLAAAPYDVRWARAAHAKALSSYQSLASRVTATAVTRTVSAGTMACFEVRAHDRVGNVSAWSVARCSTVALDDAAMTASPAWSRVSDRRLYHGSAFTTSRRGATLTLPASGLDRLAVVATQCPTCGSIAIFVGGQRIKVLDLRSATTRRRMLTALAPFGFRRAAMTIKVISSGRQVQIDGVGTSTR